MAVSPSAAGERAPLEAERLRGVLDAPGGPLRASLALASRLSLVAELEGGAELADGTELAGLSVELAGGPVRLGPARFAAAGRSGRGRLVFTEHLYDCRALVQEGRVADLRGYFENVPVVLAQKAHIRQEFRAHVADLSYDLAVYKRFFDEQDRILATEPHDVAAAAREALVRSEGRRFLGFLDAKVAELERLVSGYTKEEHERHGFFFRRQLWPYLLASEFLKRTNLKPSGYAGDADLMVMIYENDYLGPSLFARLMHKHPLETRAAEAVRSRRRLVPRLMREALGRFPALTGHGFRVLSLACGPALELEDVLVRPEDAARIDVTLLDQDPHALELARGAVRRIEARLGAGLSARYLEDSVRTMLRTRDLRGRLGEMHFVYSMGLFDYLTGPVARAVLAKTFEVLAPGGTLVIGNSPVASPTRIHMDYWADWPLVYRTEESFLGLAEGLPGVPSLEFDETRCQMFLRLDRPPER